MATKNDRTEAPPERTGGERAACPIPRMYDGGRTEAARFLVMGNVDSGKTSLIGVLGRNVLDDGKGYARSLIVTLQHEIDTGRTSSHAHHYIVQNNRITTLIDLCGHEKYFKTTMFGVTGLFGDYGIVVVGANMGVQAMTREHIMLLIANRIPFIIVVTKIDICPAHIMCVIEKDLNRIAQRNKRTAMWFKDEVVCDSPEVMEQTSTVVSSFQAGSTTFMPIIVLSNKTGHNIPFVRKLLTTLDPRVTVDPFVTMLASSELTTTAPEPGGDMIPITLPVQPPTVFFIDNVYSVPGIGVVLSGTNRFGSIGLGQKLYLGPIRSNYISLTVRSLRNCIDETVTTLKQNESGSVGIRLETKGAFTKETFRKGQVLIADLLFALAHTCYSFNCDVAVFNHQTTIRNGYQSIIHCQTVRQVAKFALDSEMLLRSNSKQNINAKFLLRPEFILPGHLFMFRDGRTKGMGRINSIIPFQQDRPDPLPSSTRGRRVAPKTLAPLDPSVRNKRRQRLHALDMKRLETGTTQSKATVQPKSKK